MPARNPCTVLGLAPSATGEQLEATFTKLTSKSSDASRDVFEAYDYLVKARKANERYTASAQPNSIPVHNPRHFSDDLTEGRTRQAGLTGWEEAGYILSFTEKRKQVDDLVDATAQPTPQKRTRIEGQLNQAKPKTWKELRKPINDASAHPQQAHIPPQAQVSDPIFTFWFGVTPMPTAKVDSCSGLVTEMRSSPRSANEIKYSEIQMRRWASMKSQQEYDSDISARSSSVQAAITPSLYDEDEEDALDIGSDEETVTKEAGI
ncbi:hypothetical protein EJ08DRAFT_730984 [Tothia fuscella]|uniref:Uncharacterized protein n=1 Tax=Tothia fuscella TaxID=1048955 RepID=A0A9P4NXM9_9PEZI|nr:hypothetical protein EJ08DRAFT_730984 [Tothia fuscella]